MIRELRAREGDRLLVLDAGGNGDNGDEIGARTAATLGEAMAAIGYDAVGIGEEEASFGRGLLDGFGLDRPGLPLISANVVEVASGRRIAPPYAIRVVGGARVGIVSVASPELDETFVKDRHPGLHALDPAPVLDEIVAELQPRVDLVVLLTHVGPERSRELGRRYRGAVLVLTGGSSSGAPHREPPWGPAHVEPGSTVQSAGVGGLGQWVGIYRIALNPLLGSYDIQAGNRELVEGVVADDPQLSAIVERYNAELAEMVIGDPAERQHALDQLLGEDSPRYRGSGECFPCHDAILKAYMGTGHGEAFRAIERTPARRNNPHCLSCHTTFFNLFEGEDGRQRAVYADVGVGCEACHGPAGDHPDDPENREAMRGMHPVTAEVCTRCHTPEQTPDFSFETHWTKIQHPEPPPSRAPKRR